MKQRIYILLITLLAGVNAVWAGPVPHIETYNGKTYNVVYLKNGSSGDGSSHTTPVGTWANAFKKLENTDNMEYDWEHNIIVVLGEMTICWTADNAKDKDGKSGTPATITNTWPWDENEKATTADIKAGKVNNTNQGGNLRTVAARAATSYIGSPIRFRNLWFKGRNSDQDRFYLNMNSCIFDVGLVMTDFGSLTTNLGMIKDREAPGLHIELTRDYTNTKGNPYRMPGDKAMTVIFRSGRYGRIVMSRTQGTNNTAVQTNYIQGTPNNPIMARFIVDIEPGNDNTGNYPDDICFISGGSTQGIVCADLEFDFRKGKIGTLVAGTQGNGIDVCYDVKIPAATYAGRTIVNFGVEGGDNNDLVLQTYYGGTQGRVSGTTPTKDVSSFFYGQSELNMYSGTIKSGVFASASAFSGLAWKDDPVNHHTIDYAIPYVNASNELTFGSYDAKKKMATIKSGFVGKEDIDLSTTKISYNVYGGVIEGGLYGGSSGYASEITPSKGWAPKNCGTHFGDTDINIYGGTIKGGIYGGGLGTSEYYNQCTDATKKLKYLDVAQVFGDTHVRVYGGIIQGNIYGGGGGIASKDASTGDTEFRDIAKVYGTTNVTIDPKILKPFKEWTVPNVPEFTGPNESWTFNSNIYGGGALGAVEGETNVTILGGIINGNVFGGSKGEEGHPDKAKVTGKTNVIVDKNWTE